MTKNLTKKRRYYYQKWKQKANRNKILFIAVSPPKKPSYFYFDKTKIISKSLSFYLFKALKIVKDNRKEALEEFVKNYVLIDAIENPIFNKNRLKNKGKQIYKNLDRIKKEIKSLEPSKIIIIDKEVYDILSNILSIPSKKLEWVYYPTNRCKVGENTQTALFEEKIKKIIRKFHK